MIMDVAIVTRNLILGLVTILANKVNSVATETIIHTFQSTDITMNSTMMIEVNATSAVTNDTSIPLAWLTNFSMPVYMGCTLVSLITCMVAFAIYVIIREVQEVRVQTRHWINWHFMSSFILRDAVLVITMTMLLMPEYMEVAMSKPWRAVVVYTIVPNFFWMFVEGLHLYLGVFYPFWIRSFKWKKSMMVAIGWAVPATLTTVWVLQQYIANDGFHDFMAIPGLVCILVPIYLVLLINLIMMIRIIFALTDKMEDTMEGYRCQSVENYKKGVLIVRRMAKCTIVISVLLGVPQLIPVVISYSVSNYSVHVVVLFLNSIWSALQGFFCCHFLCLDEQRTNVAYKKTSVQLNTPFTCYTTTILCVSQG